MPVLPRPVNTPIGATGGKRINTGRPKPGPASPAKQKSYIEHMLEADKAYHAAQPAPPARGSSGGLSGVLAKGNPPVGAGGRAREATIMGDVDKMSR